MTQQRGSSQVSLAVVGGLVETGQVQEPFRLVDADGATVGPVAVFFRELEAANRSPATIRSYGMDLLRWFRFLWTVGIAWDRATSVEARDFARWLRLGDGVHQPYSASVRAHSETVLRGFYAFHLEEGLGPVLNPFPLDRARRGRRAHAHHNPMDPHREERVGRYRPVVASRIPRSVPDEEFNEIFARLPSDRDRALVAFYVSTGARASELLSVRQGGVDPGRQLITVVRKGTGASQQLPASTDAFVWLRLYQAHMEGLVPAGREEPLWWTIRRPARPLTYHGVHRMFERVNARAGTRATLHSLRHTAAYRMAEDPTLPLTDVQAVLGHAQLSTTQIYLTPRKEDVIRRVLDHYAEQSRQAAERTVPPPAPGYRPETLDVLFGGVAR
ncbi:tyrosine-type recombinase/integrase [Georgenia yuyongxinii]